MEAYEIDATRNPVVFQKDGVIFATSRDVAASFEKRHDHVIRDIRNLSAKEPDWCLRNFGEFKNNDLTGETTSHFEMTRDGFSLLTMGFTGAKALRWKLRYIEAFNVMETELRGKGEFPPGANMDHLAELSGRVHTELAEYRGFVGKEIGGVKGALLHYVKECVVGPLGGLRQYLDDRFMAVRERDKMLLGNDAAIMDAVAAMRRDNATVLTFARRALDPEAFIRPEWCDLHDVYVMAGAAMPIPRRAILSTHVSRALDTFCKSNNRQEDMRAWPHAGKSVSYWRKIAVQSWLRGGGAATIRQHCQKHGPQGTVVPFRSREEV